MQSVGKFHPVSRVLWSLVDQLPLVAAKATRHGGKPPSTKGAWEHHLRVVVRRARGAPGGGGHTAASQRMAPQAERRARSPQVPPPPTAKRLTIDWTRDEGVTARGMCSPEPMAHRGTSRPQTCMLLQTDVPRRPTQRHRVVNWPSCHHTHAPPHNNAHGHWSTAHPLTHCSRGLLHFAPLSACSRQQGPGAAHSSLSRFSLVQARSGRQGQVSPWSRFASGQALQAP